MKHNSFAVQAALIAFLRAEPRVTVLVGQRSYDAVPSSVLFPYLEFGLTRTKPFRVNGAHGSSTTLEVYVWTRPSATEVIGKRQAEQITGELAEVLHGSALNISGHGMQGVFVEQSSVARMGDGLTVRGIVTLRVDTLNTI